MTWDPTAQAALSALAILPDVRRHKAEATQRLLGDTITLSERAWQEPSRLPGWTRAHVASHVARNADALVKAVDSVLMGRRGLMYDSDEDRMLAIERGSERTGLDLQVDLDTAAGRLNQRLTVMETVPANLMVELLPGKLFRSDLLALARLNEVVLHHVDLDCGFEVTDVDALTARWLLEWNVLSVPPGGVPPVMLRSETGMAHDLGQRADAPVVAGPDAVLLGWLTGRLAPEQAEVFGFPEQPHIY